MLPELRDGRAAEGVDGGVLDGEDPVLNLDPSRGFCTDVLQRRLAAKRGESEP